MVDESILSRLKALKDEAWSAVIQTDEYKAYSALKRAVAAMEGQPEAAPSGIPAPPLRRRRVVTVGGVRISQVDAAERALRQAGRPLTTTELLNVLPSLGAVVGGENPELNLASSLSRSEIVQSVRIDGVAKWRINSDADTKTATDA